MRTVFITGAARGIGLAIARRFARDGWFVGLYDLDGDTCAKLATSAEFPAATGAYCDVTDRQSVEAALDRFSEATAARLDLLVNNAGVLTASPLVEQSPEQIDQMIAVNIRGLTQVSQLAFPLLRDTPQSMVLNLCSASSIHGIPLLAVYSASKFYVDGLTQALSLEWEADDIHVSCLKPPPINTQMGNALHPKHRETMSADMEAEAVADAAAAAVVRRRPHHILGAKTRIWHALDRLLPAGMRRRLTRSLVPV